MKRILWVVVVVVLAWLPLTAQDPSLPVRRLPDGKPDISGVYGGPGFANKSTMGVPPATEELIMMGAWNRNIYTPLIRADAQKFFNRKPTGNLREDDPTAVCLPFPFPHIAVVSPYSTEILQANGHVVLFYEYMRFFKNIPIGAANRPHSDWDGELTYMGNAIGWWEGDTLVIDTVGLKEQTMVFYHSDAVHTVERYKPLDEYRVDYEITYDDPKVFTKPWTQNWRITRHPTWKLLEYVCEENNRCVGGTCSKAEGQQ